MSGKYKGQIMTVLGPVKPSAIGVTQMHEHMIIDFLAVSEAAQQSHSRGFAEGGGGLNWNDPISLANYYAVRRNPFLLKEAMQLIDVDLITAAVSEFRQAGGSCLVEVTPIGVGRNPVAMRQISEKTGVTVVMGTAFYVRDFHPPEIAKMTEDQVADIFVTDFEKGSGNPPVHPGIIGEIGLVWPVHPDERKVLCAAAKAQQRTGLCLSIHPGRNPAAPLDAIDIVMSAGGDPKRAIICHLDRTIFEMKDYLALAKTGCYLEMDLFGWETRHYPLSDIDMPNDATRIDNVIQLVNSGHLQQVLLSHDVDSKLRLRAYGGEGYQHILENVVPVMKRKGLSEMQVNQILIENPRRALAIA
jgi:phosphotriesterase-related protein